MNRLKLIKRSMYGRAKFDLLRLRVLHPSRKNLQGSDKPGSAVLSGGGAGYVGMKFSLKKNIMTHQ